MLRIRASEQEDCRAECGRLASNPWESGSVPRMESKWKRPALAHCGVSERMWATMVLIFSLRAIWMRQATRPYRGLAPWSR
jgi:hypothetical protein